MCRNNYVDHLKEFPITNQVLKDKESLMGWTVKIHNIVNKSNNKRVVPIKEGIEMVEKSSENEDKKEGKEGKEEKEKKEN